MKRLVQILVIVIILLLAYIVYLSNREKFQPVTPTPTQSPTMVFSPTPTQSPTPTFTRPPTFDAKIASTTFCHIGPNKSFVGQIPVSEGMYVEILATIDKGDWYMIRSIDVNLDPCWIEENALIILDENFDLTRAQIFTTILTTNNTNCRLYPDELRSTQTIIPSDRRVVAYGRSDHDAHWILVVPHDSTNFCWIENKSNENYSSLPIEAPGFALAPTPTSTATNPPIIMPTNTRRRNNDDDDNNDPHPNTPAPPPSETPVPPPTKTPVPPPTKTPLPPPTPTLCWPPGHCKK